MIVLKHGKISKAVLRKKIILSALGIGKEANFLQGDLADSLERSLLLHVSLDSGLLGEAWEFLPIKVLGKHLSEIVWV